MTKELDFGFPSLSRPDIEGSVLDLVISPTGRIHLGLLPSQSNLSQSATNRITKAFERGSGHGLLHLGAVELETWLPPSLAFGRELAHLFMARLCAVPDLAGQWASIEIAAPIAELEKLVAAMPPMVGAEYLDVARFAMLWADLQAAARAEIAAENGDVQAWLKQKHSSWSLVGRVCFHLAENKSNLQAPFAFLATYAMGVSPQSRVQHQPLGRALQESASTGDRNTLLGLLLPVNKAAEQSPWLQSLVDSGAIFQPVAWSPGEAHQFLRNLPIFEACGIVVRIPDWWKPQQPPRPQVQVNIGKSVAGLGLDAMLDFNVSLTLDGEELSRAEWEQLLSAGEGLVRIKGRWVEVDREKLDSVLAHWKKVQRDADGGGISFLDGMRLLAGAALEGNDRRALPEGSADWSTVIAGDWLQEALDGLRNPHGEAYPGPELKAQLRPYQQDGVRWLWWLNRLGLGGCLADDMGLGKTVQILALFLLAKREADPGPHLLVLPASLIGNWQSEIARFAPSLRILVAHPSALSGNALTELLSEQINNFDVVITSYGSLIRLPSLIETRWSMVVLDEAQAIKNPGARQTQVVKALKSRVRFALTGTPVENRLGDLWSLFDFICPGLLGSAKAFTRFTRQLEQDEHAGYAPLRNLVQPYILRRLKSDKRIIADLPDKTEVKAYCTLSRLQASLYEQAVDALAKQIETLDGISRRGVVLAFLMRFKQICNHPSQWLGDGVYGPADSGKFFRLREITEAIAARQEKVLVFTQFQEMTGPLAEFLQGVFGQPGLVLHGKTPVKSRKSLVDHFQQEQGPPFFVLSIKAGGTGLNLTAASHVIHFDRWWNPAVENQATDRAYRIGQKKNVLVHKFICRGTIEEKIDALIEAKLGLSNDMLTGGGEMSLTEMSNDALLKLVSLDINSVMTGEK
ncbi:MAG: DEAD/DEAH box helicase [Collimonas sp.]|uniref:DEAD/DEAH box helicase n=1 Tax=Collimonas sp. TaxID=1963772 RepID=UPI003263C776